MLVINLQLEMFFAIRMILIVYVCCLFLDADHCSPNPCLHGGACKDLGDAYKCDCPMTYKGKQCEGMRIQVSGFICTAVAQFESLSRELRLGFFVALVVISCNSELVLVFL